MIEETDFVLMDPLTRRRFDAEDMNLSLREAGLEPRSSLILQRSTVSGISVSPSSLPAQRVTNRSSRVLPREHEERIEVSEARRAQMRETAAHAAAQR